MAAHAASMRGHDVMIFSKARKSFMNGAQYLHRPIPMASSTPFKITYALDGPIEGYRDKVYGRDSRVQVSPESLVGVSDAWDIREAYDWLWETYGDYVHDIDLSNTAQWGGMGGFLSAMTPQPDIIISTVPASLLCEKFEEHQFHGVRVWATNTAHALNRQIPANIVVCSGESDVPWYRQSRIHGFLNTEYPEHKKPPVTEGIWEVIKPTQTNCDCLPHVIRLGRYGAWKKGVLAHEAFYDTYSLLEP